MPTVEQERALQEMIDSFDERSRPLHAMERRATIEALIRAAAAGSFESVDVGPQPTTDLSRYSRNAAKAGNELVLRLMERFGTAGVDWTWASIGSSEPDGVPRVNIVYFLRRDAGEVFRLRAAEGEVIRERRRAYLEFFERL